MNLRRKCSIISLTCLLSGQILASGFGFAQPNPAPASKLSAAITFRCLWWSEKQMDGLNPNAPPPKTTEVTLNKWEYSDPIGVPHPDVVDLVVELGNTADAEVNDLTVNVSTRWLIGPQSKKSRAVWGKAALVERLSSFKIAGHDKHILRIPVNLADQMRRLEKTRFWPWRLQATVLVTSASGKALLRKQADLPITPGD
ncbi:MAG: hypothetical protein JST85_22060 [Acidobacteria bacterium]|nr:hypothetical protein [Acidobacteriota bacterium]